MMNETPFTRRGRGNQGAPAEAGRSDTIDGGEPTAAGSVVGAASATGCSESVDDATLSFLAGGRSASRRMTSSRQSSLTACFFSSSAPSTCFAGFRSNDLKTRTRASASPESSRAYLSGLSRANGASTPPDGG